jgi:phage terminase large subunit GpA-like protein
MDEVDLYPPSAIKKARARTRAFRHERKIMEACTASTIDGRIWDAQHHVQEVRDYYVPCPHCGHYQTIKFEGIRWAEGIVDPDALSEKGSAWYECEECQGKWDEEDRDEAVLKGEWRGRGKIRHLRPSSIWCHIPPLLSRFVFFNEIAVSYLLTLTEPTEENFRNHYNDNLGLPVPVNDENEQIQEKELYERRIQYAPEGSAWRIPMAACILTAAVDVQGNRLECEVVAWGPGDESWGIEYRTFHGKPQETAVWDQLHDYLQEKKFRHESGIDLSIIRAGIDLGYCADQVSKFVKRSRKYIAHKGSNIRGLPLVPRKPSKGKYKVSFYELGTDTGKDTLFTWLNNDSGGPRCCHFPIGHGYDFEYFRMLCAEHGKKDKDKKTGRMVTIWQMRPGYIRNEALDIRVYNMAVRQILNPNYKKLAEYLRQQVEAPTEEIKQALPVEKEKPQLQMRKTARLGGFVSSWKK